MSWLTKRVQTARLRGKYSKKQAQGIRRRMPVQAGGKTKARFLSASINTINGKGEIKGGARIDYPPADDRDDHMEAN